MISQWWFGVYRAIRRTPGSGGWSKTQSAGDLISEINPFPWSVECKDNKSWDFRNDLFKPDLGDIGDYWRQCIGDSKAQFGKVPLLTFKGLRSKQFCAFRPEDVQFKYKYGETNFIRAYVGLPRGQDEIVIMHLEEFIAANDPLVLLAAGSIRGYKGTPEELTEQRKFAADAPQFKKGYTFPDEEN